MTALLAAYSVVQLNEPSRTRSLLTALTRRGRQRPALPQPLHTTLIQLVHCLLRLKRLLRLLGLLHLQLVGRLLILLLGLLWQVCLLLILLLGLLWQVCLLLILLLGLLWQVCLLLILLRFSIRRRLLGLRPRCLWLRCGIPLLLLVLLLCRRCLLHCIHCCATVNWDAAPSLPPGIVGRGRGRSILYCACC